VVRLNRRAFVASLAGAALGYPLAAPAQQAERLRTVGILMPLRLDDPQAQLRIAVFSQILRQIGWVEGRTIAFEKRFSNGEPERLSGLTLDLVHANVDVIVTQAAQPVEAAHEATTTIPIVIASVADAVGSGYVESLAHPGGNITGLTLVATDQSAKRMQLVKEAVPAAARVAALTNANASGHRLALSEMEPAAAKVGMAFQSLPVKSISDIDGALDAAARANAQALITMDDPVGTGANR
jgi:putative ABC transport system substrate-binding protein